MSEVSRSSPYRSTPDAPVTERERNELSARLNSAYEAGSLEQDDFAARLDRLFAAQRMGELLPVVEGLPPLTTHANPAIVDDPVGAAGPGELTAARSGARFTVVALAVLVAVVLLIVILLSLVF